MQVAKVRRPCDRASVGGHGIAGDGHRQVRNVALARVGDEQEPASRRRRGRSASRDPSRPAVTSPWRGRCDRRWRRPISLSRRIALVIHVDAVGGIGKPEGPVGAWRHRWGSSAACPASGWRARPRAVMLDAADDAGLVLAGDQPPLAIGGVPLWLPQPCQKTETEPSVSS